MATFSPEVASVAGARERLRSAADMDLERREGTAYEYLCHLGEMCKGTRQKKKKMWKIPHWKKSKGGTLGKKNLEEKNMV